MTRRLLILTLLFLVPSCTKVYNDDFNSHRGDGSNGDGSGGDGNPTSPTPVPPGGSLSHRVEFRVEGSALSAHISYGSDQFGTSDVSTQLPWTAAFTTSRNVVFVFITASSLDVGSIRVQIFVDGELFREAAGDFTASVSGTAQITSTGVIAITR